MATQDEDLQELEEVSVQSANRAPTLLQRAKRAPGHFAAGTRFPRLQGIFNPALYRERGDTSRLVDDVLGEEGALARLAQTDPELVAQIRQQAETPMSVGEHQKFRSALVGMVSEEAAREQKVQYQLRDNEGFFNAFRTLDGFIPGIGDAKRDTREEFERREVETLFRQAQETALLDPDHSAALMGEVRKKADALTANIRGDMEKQRKIARAEDGSLWATMRERVSETNDVVEALRDDLAKKGLRRSPNDTLIARANALLGQAGDFPAAGIADAAEGAAAVVPAGESSGNILGEGIKLAGKLADKALQKDDVEYLIQRLEFNKAQIQKSYIEDRAALAAKYKASGLEFGEQAGEVYSVPNEAYQREAEKIKAAPAKPTDHTDSLRGMLADEVKSAEAAANKTAPEASANMPGAAARHAAAQERLQIARDDVAIFEDDERQRAGRELPPVAAGAEDPAIALREARQRRAMRQQKRDSGLVRQATMEALRRYTR